MKVVHILNELRPSGAEIMLDAASDHFKAHDVESWIIATGHTSGPYTETLGAAGYKIIHIPTGESPVGLLAYYQALKRIKPNVVHVHAERLSYWVCLLALSAGCRVVRTFHGVFRFDGLLRMRRQLQRRHLQSLGVASVAISRSVQENERRRFRIAPVIIDNWIDIRKFPIIGPYSRAQARAAFIREANTFILLTVGNCSTIKNHASVLQAMSRIGGKINMLYLHVGLEEDGEPERELAQSLGLQNHVIFVGKTANVVNYLHACDLFIMPSLHEGFGLAAAEAVASGARCLFADVDGLRDFRSAFPWINYCAPTADSIATSIIQIYQNLHNESRAQSANVPLEQVRKFLTPERGAREYLELYRGTPCKQT